MPYVAQCHMERATSNASCHSCHGTRHWRTHVRCSAHFAPPTPALTGPQVSSPAVLHLGPPINPARGCIPARGCLPGSPVRTRAYLPMYLPLTPRAASWRLPSSLQQMGMQASMCLRMVTCQYVSHVQVWTFYHSTSCGRRRAAAARCHNPRVATEDCRLGSCNRTAGGRAAVRE